MKSIFYLLMIFTAAILVFTGCGNSEENDMMQKEDPAEKVHSHMIREYDVDVATIDANGDGKVFQCPMDWEVISDEPGSCPLCNMDLKEYSVADAQQNLVENKPHQY